jgi:hypothetical protein
MSRDKDAAWELWMAVGRKLVRRLRMTDPGDTAWQQYDTRLEIDGQQYDTTTAGTVARACARAAQASRRAKGVIAQLEGKA